MNRNFRYSVLGKQLGLMVLGSIAFMFSFAGDKAVFACDPPSSVSISSVTQTSAAISFASAGNDFIIEYGAPGFTPGTGASAGAGIVVTGISSPISLNSLTAGTSYDVYVRQVCAGPEYSANSPVIEFTTLCTAVTAYTENFDGITAPAFPACFYKVTNSLGASYTQATNPASAPNTLYIFSFDETDQSVVALRPVSNAGANTHQLRFRARGNFSAGETLQVGYLTSPADAATFTLLQEFIISALTYTEYTCEPGTAPGSNQVLAFRSKGITGTSILIDDINWEPVPACSTPAGVSAGSITSVSASIAFTSGGNNFIVEYGAPGFTPGTGALAGAGSVVTGISSPITISGLTASTGYDVYVRQVCSGPVYSANTAVFSFTTACTNSSLPVTQGFNTAGTSTLPGCWTQQYVTGAGDISFETSSPNPATSAFEGTRHVFWDAYNYSEGEETRLVSPPITTTGTASVDVEFYWYNQNSLSYNSGSYLNEGVQVQYSLDGETWVDAGAFIPRQDGTLAPGAGQWKKKTITLPGAAGNQATIYVAFKFHSEFGENCSLDAVEIKASPDCAAPSAVSIGSVDFTAASVSFNSSGNNFIVEYGAPGFIPGTGATPGAGTIVTGTASPVQISSLTAATSYDVYVRQVCSGSSSYSANSPVVQFTTLCIATNVPYTENFDAVTAPAIPDCITLQNVNGGNTWTNVGTDFSVSAPNIMRLDYETDGVTAADDWFFTRALNLTGGTTYRLKFQYRNSDGALWVEKLEVKYGTAPAAAFMNSGTLFINTNINFNAWSEGGIDFTPASTGIYFIGFHGFSDADKALLAIDDISVDVTPACAPPIGVNVSVQGATSATVNFTLSGSNYIIEYGPAGFTPGIGAIAGLNGTAVAVTSGQVPYTINGLTTLTSYDVYVRQTCTGPVYGPNSTKVNFTTLLENDNAPGAIAVTVGSGCTGEPYTNAGATQSAGEPFGSCSSTTGYATVWYKFIAPASGAVRISTATGSGTNTNTLTDSRIALFSATDVNNYATFDIISCDDDNGSSSYGLMSVLYATGLTPGTTYYVQVDVYDDPLDAGTFCLAVDELNSSMLASSTSCAAGQTPFGSVPTYTGWASLVDESSNLIAMVRNPAGGNVSAYSVSQNIHTGTVRSDITSSEYYLNRNYNITNTEASNVNVQLFFLNSELTDLQNVDAVAALSNLSITRQTGTCQPDFGTANGTNSELAQAGNGSAGGISWVNFTTPGFSNFYLHSTKGQLIVKAFLQGAYSAADNRHKNVTATWAAVLNANALSQPYNTAAFGNYAGTESVANGFFTSNPGATTDIVDWVLLEIKDASNVLITRRAAFIREDGQVVDLDGISPVIFNGLNTNNYHITIRHRNHLGISTQNMTAINAKSLGVALATGFNFDFSTSSETNIFGTATAYKIIGSTNVMIGGNANSNNNIRYGGLSNDPASILLFLGGTPLVTMNNVYSGNDVNMDGSVRYGGLNNDPGFLLASALGGSSLVSVTEQKR